MTDHSEISAVAKEIFVMSRRNDRLRALLTDQHPGAKDICDTQTELLRALDVELGVMKRFGLWGRLNELLGQAHNVDPIVQDMIDTIKHPEAAKEAREWADTNLP